MNTRSCYDSPVGGITQHISQRRDLSGNLDVKGHYLKSSARVEGRE